MSAVRPSEMVVPPDAACPASAFWDEGLRGTILAGAASSEAAGLTASST